MLSSPALAIVIPTYEMKGHGVLFLQRALASIEKQIDIDPKSLEILVSDQSVGHDIEHFCKTTSHPVHYHRTTTRRGIAAHNLNSAIALAKGEYIKILFQDDVLVEDYYLSRLRKIIHTDKPDVILTGALHTGDGETFTDPITPQNNPYFLFGNNTVSSPSVITMRREVANTLFFDESLKMLFDCDFYYRLFAQSLNIAIAKQIHIANGIWEGQAQHQIDFQQFTKEVRYLHWKYPQAKLMDILPQYRAYFGKRHPTAPFPFNINLNVSLWQRAYWALTRKQTPT
jgi:GT2 family glycosyltransferase